jgi:selenocysteine lyase/cysteine desulfurase
VTAFPVNAVRADTPGCRTVLHFNNAGASLPPRPVIFAQTEWILEEAVTGGYEMAARYADRIDDVYRSLARLVNTGPDEIALVENATVAWWQAFHTFDLAGKKVLTSEVDYGSNFISYLQAARRGVETVVLSSDETGQVSLDALEEQLDAGGVGLVAISHMPTNGGLVNPAAEIGARTRAAGVPFLLDACQTVGQMPIDVDAIGCDLLVGTGRKYLRGPRGTGFLYVRRSLLERTEPAMLDHFGAEWVAVDRYELRRDARRYETWERNNAAVVGLGAAVDYALGLGLDAIWERIRTLAETLRSGLEERSIPTYDLGELKGGIVTFAVDGVEATEVMKRLHRYAINVSVSRPPSTLVDAVHRGLPDLVRASVHYYNTDDEIERFLEVVAELTG